MELWSIVRRSSKGVDRSVLLAVRTGKIRIYFASPDGDRLVEIHISKPKRGKRRNRPTHPVIYDDVVDHNLEQRGGNHGSL